LWDKKLVLKGIMDTEDARRAIDAGADAIVVSNHDGRQLDGAPSSIHVLPIIAKAVGGQTEVWFDGGIRSGQDVLREIALGGRKGRWSDAHFFMASARWVKEVYVSVYHSEGA
jgi:L-lactate dehydrogenase (cytochrome)